MDEHQRRAHQVYIEALRKLTPEQRLVEALRMGEMTRGMFKHGLRRRFPDMPADQLHKLYLERLDKCHNRNY